MKNQSVRKLKSVKMVNMENQLAIQKLKISKLANILIWSKQQKNRRLLQDRLIPTNLIDLIGTILFFGVRKKI